jgi:hypothetical protein
VEHNILVLLVQRLRVVHFRARLSREGEGISDSTIHSSAYEFRKYSRYRKDTIIKIGHNKTYYTNGRINYGCNLDNYILRFVGPIGIPRCLTIWSSNALMII